MASCIFIIFLVLLKYILTISCRCIKLLKTPSQHVTLPQEKKKIKGDVMVNGIVGGGQAPATCPLNVLHEAEYGIK